MNIDESVFIAQGAIVKGDVTIGAGSSIWYNAVVRADCGPVTIGKNSNVQDNCVVHLDYNTEVHIGDNVTIGHGAIIHGCTIGNNTLIGMGAIILNDAVIGNNCVVGAGALVTGRTVIPDNSMVVGSPAKVKRELTPEEIKGIALNAAVYVEEAQAAKNEEE